VDRKEREPTDKPDKYRFHGNDLMAELVIRALSAICAYLAYLWINLLSRKQETSPIGDGRHKKD
jgi:hypothetical protein